MWAEDKESVGEEMQPHGDICALVFVCVCTVKM